MLKAITIRQPWASMIVAGHKPVENRSWATAHRGLLVITASKTLRNDDLEECQDILGTKIDRDSLPLGAIIGTAVISDCVTSHRSKWFFGEYGFVMTQPKLFRRPIPCSGKLGLWKLSPELSAKVARLL